MRPQITALNCGGSIEQDDPVAGVPHSSNPTVAWQRMHREPLCIRYAGNAMMKRLLFLSGLIFCAAHSHAATCPISSGASSATIASTIQGCTSGNTVTFAAGSYSLSSSVNVPCGVSITGPVVSRSSFSPDGYVHLLYGPTAIISATAYPVFNYGACSKASSLEYLEVNSNRPSSGGQVVYATSSGGVSNLTISYNYFHGNNWNASGECFGCSLIEFDGSASATVDTGDTVSWNRLGANGDCASVMSNFSYSGYTGDGGFCSAISWHTNMTNMTLSNNFIYYQEEGIKGYEGSWVCSNCLLQANDLSNWHRIAIETQIQGTGTTIAHQYNSMHDPYDPGNGMFGLSSAGCGSNTNSTSGGCTTIDNSNVIIDNIAVNASSPDPYNGLGIEFWSAGSASTGNYNLIQGEWANSFMISTDGAMTASNNLIQSSFGAGGNNTPANCYPGFPGPYGWWNTERSPANTPSGSGNTCDFFDGSLQPSATPTISPATGTFTGSQAWTITNTGTNRDSNAGEWCTTDGSTPTPGSGTAQYYATGTGGTVTTTTTVKCVGMWGAANQPTSYPSGYGYGPSAMVSATYTGNLSVPKKTVVSGYLRPKSGANSVMVGGTVQMTAYVTYSDGSTGTLPDAQGNVVTWWNTSNHAVGKISTLGHATALAAGSIRLEGMIGPLTLTPWPVTVVAAPVPATAAAVAASPAADVQPAVAADAQASAGPDTPAAAAATAAPATQSGLTALTPGPAPAAPAGPVADAFLGPFWMLVTPAGGSAAISNSHLFIGVPGGGNHDPLVPSNQAVRVVQAIGNEDFDVAVKIDSPLVASDGNTSQGLMVLSGNANFITFALTTNGTSIGLNARMVTGGVAATLLDDSDFTQYQNPMYLRVTKAGSAFVTFYSLDGTNWTQAASFTDAATFTSIGPFASNYNDTPANATPVVMSVNWFDVLQ